MQALLLVPAMGMSAAQAANTYDPGNLNFSFSNQSIWGTGTGIAPQTLTASKSWNGSTTLGGITGSSNALISAAVPSMQLTPYVPPQLIIPAVPGVAAVYTTVWEPRVGTWNPTPTWNNPFAGHWTYTGCNCNVQVLVTPAIPGIPAVYSPAVPATYSPAVPAVYGDTRNGVSSALASSGNVSVTSSFGFNSGTLNASMGYKAQLSVPDTLAANSFVKLNPTQNLLSGSLSSSLPKLQGTLSAAFTVKNTAVTEVCAYLAGCSTSGGTVTNINTGSFKLLEMNTPGLRDKVSVMGLDAVAFDLTRMRAFVDYKPGQVIVSLPGMTRPPGASINLGVLDLDYPDLAVSGKLSNGKLTASGKFDNVVRLDADLDGVFGATVAGGGFAGGVVLDRPPVTYRLDAVDLKVGPTIDIGQDLDMTPTLMVGLSFSDFVKAKALDGTISLVKSWSGKLADLPEFALQKATDLIKVDPSFWVSATVKNQLKLAFDTTIGVSLLKGEAIVSLVSSPVMCVVCEDFASPALGVPLASNSFTVESAHQSAAAFWLVGEGVTAVPEPGTYALFGIGLLGLRWLRRDNRRSTTP